VSPRMEKLCEIDRFVKIYDVPDRVISNKCHKNVKEEFLINIGVGH